MNKIYHQIGLPIVSAINKMWHYVATMDVTIRAAWIATLTSVVVFLAQDWVQRRKEGEQQNETEKNKLVYLNFLLNDTFKLIDDYDRNYKYLDSTFKINPFIVTRTNIYSNQSLEIIVNKLDQEQYYLSSINQLKNNDFAQIFLSCNLIYHKLIEFQQEYKVGSDKSLTDHEALASSLRELQNQVNNICLMSPEKFNSFDKKGQKELDEFWIATGTGLAMETDPAVKLYTSLPNFINPVIDILAPYSQTNGPLRDLILMAYESKRQYKACCRASNYLMGYSHLINKQINQEYKKIKDLRKPLVELAKKAPEPMH